MLKDSLHLHFIVMLWGFTAIVGKQSALDSTVLVFYRTLFAALALLVIILLLKKRNPVPAKAKRQMIFTGFIVSLHWIMFFGSAKIANVNICLVGMATTTLFTAFLEPLIMKSKLKWYEILLGVVVVSGIFIIFMSDDIATSQDILGFIVALGSAFLAALFSILNKRFAGKYNPMPITYYEMIGACLCAVLLIPIYIQVMGYEWTWMAQSISDKVIYLLPSSASDWTAILFLSLICSVYAFYFSVEILKRMSAFNVNLTINMEPIYGIILAYFFLKEQMTSTFYFGGAVILLAVASYPTLEKRFGKKESI